MIPQLNVRSETTTSCKIYNPSSRIISTKTTKFETFFVTNKLSININFNHILWRRVLRNKSSSRTLLEPLNTFYGGVKKIINLAKNILERATIINVNFLILKLPYHPTTNKKKRSIISNHIQFDPIENIILIKLGTTWKIKIVPNLHGFGAISKNMALAQSLRICKKLIK